MNTENRETGPLNLPVPFGFYRFILKCDHLHFGLWPEEGPALSMEEAQYSMFSRLLSFLPQPPLKVLDVGCGLGYSAYLLAQKGYNVVAIAPDPELIGYASRSYKHSSVEFKALGFFDDDKAVFGPGQYDVILMQESAQYLGPLDNAIKRAGRLLKNTGTIIIGDEVCYDRTIKNETAVHPASEFIIALSENGFRITEHQKIGENVRPTCDFVIDGFTKNYKEIISESGRPDTEAKLLLYLNGWKKQRDWYSSGAMGYELFTARKDNFSMGVYTPGDESVILQRFKDIFKTERTLEHWNWKFRDNPYGAYKISKAVSGDNLLAVHYAGYPAPFYSSVSGAKDFISYQIGDTMTGPEVRNIGLGKTGLLARTAHYFYAKFCEDTVPFIYGFNTGKIKKLGMRYLEYSYINPVTYRVIEVSKVKVDCPPGYVVEEVPSVNFEWDDLFDRVCSSYKLMVRRDARYITWRYINCPDKVHRVFAVRLYGRLIGWSVFTHRGNSLVWGDALFDNKHPGAVSHLLQRIAKDYFTGIEQIEGWFSRNPEWWDNLLEDTGFIITPEPNDLTPGFVLFGDAVTIEDLQNHFYYTWGDSDLF